MLSNLKIGTRLTLGFSVMILMMILISGIAITSFSRINGKVDVITDDKWPKAVMLNEINNSINVTARALRNMVISPLPEVKAKELGRITEANKAIAKNMEQLDKVVASREGKAMFQEIKDREVAYKAGLKEALDLIAAGKDSEAGAFLLTKLRSFQQPYIDSVAKMIEHQGKGVVTASDAVEATSKAARMEIVVILLISLLVAGTIGVFTTRSIVVPLGQAVEVNKAIAEGNLKVVATVGRKDEIGQLNDSANIMIGNLRGIVGHLSSTSDQVASAATQLHANAEQMATTSEEVASQSGTVATAGEEMAATSGDIALTCNRAAEASQQASNVAKEGGLVVSRTVEVMGKIAEKVQLSARTVESLGERSDQIGAIVGTIEDIADQTNLLALNAAIEAARAGEQGRGFAVVADEVRALAERTTRATREISEMIKTIQSETKGAVGTMDEGVREVESGTAEAAKSGEALREILEQVDAVTLQVGQIATAAEEQTATTSEISSNIMQMTEIVQQTARGAQDSSQAASALAHLADDLKSIVAKFALP